MKFARLLPFAALAFAASASAQQMYRCKTPDGKVAFQDKPCASGASQSSMGMAPSAAANANPKLRPVEGLSQEQKRDYNALLTKYMELARIVGRAEACGVPGAKDRFLALMEPMKQRHGENDNAFMAWMMGYAAGKENRALTDIGETKPRPPVPCDIITGQFQSAALPPVPASLVLREGQPVDRILNEGNSPNGSIRFITRTPPGGGAAEHLVIHRERIVFRSAEPFDKPFDYVWGGPTPVLIVATLSPVRKCLDGRPYKTWHAVSLPATGAPVVSDIEADCMRVMTNKQGFCAWQNSGNDQRPTRIYRIDDAGNVALSQQRPPGQCPPG